MSHERADAPASRPPSLAPAALAAAKAAASSKGLLFVPRFPTGLNPQRLRDLLAPHGALGRMHVTPETPSASSRSKHARYIEGWVEFEDKAAAKTTAALLHGTPFSTKSKNDPLAGELWSLVYLPGFKWHHLMEAKVGGARLAGAQARTAAVAARKGADAYADKAGLAAALARKEAKRVAGGDGEGVARERERHARPAPPQRGPRPER